VSRYADGIRSSLALGDLKKLSILAFLAASAIQQSAQSFVDPNTQTFLAATNLLRSNQLLFINLTGSIEYKGRVVPIVSNLYWNSVMGGKNGTVLTQQVEIESWSNGALVRRITGDGSTLYAYDLTARTYSATSYSASTVRPPMTYLDALVYNLDRSVRGPDAYLIKMLRQIYDPAVDGGGNPQFISWMPTTFSQQLSGATTDPVNRQVGYTPTPTESFYMYNGSPKRTIVFDLLAGTNNSPDSLQTVYFNQVDYLAGQPRLTQWQMHPYTGQVFNPTLFQPYTGNQLRGWKMVVAATPYSG